MWTKQATFARGLILHGSDIAIVSILELDLSFHPKDLIL